MAVNKTLRDMVMSVLEVRWVGARNRSYVGDNGKWITFLVKYLVQEVRLCLKNKRVI